MSARVQCLSEAPVTWQLIEPMDGVLVLDGYGVRVAVERSHLIAEGGTGTDRRRGRFSRLDRELKRVVIIGHTGTITLDAVRWLHGVGVPLVHLDTDGTLFLVAAPSGAIVPTLRRAQALAAETGLGVRLSQELITAKVEGQRRLLNRLPGSEDVQKTMQELIQAIDKARRLPDLRRLEAMAARAYWRAWQGLPLRFDTRDAKRCPKHWLRCGTRASPLTSSQSPRKAVTPAQAVLNYLYAILEAEARIAALAVGLDPVLGLLHADQRNRDSLASDLMEPVRPAEDAYVLDFLDRHTFTKADVYELFDGQCRLLPPLTEQLAKTAWHWARRVMPIAQQLAGRLIAEEARQVSTPLVPYIPNRGSKGHRRGQRVVIREYSARVEPEKDGRRNAAAGTKRRVAMKRVVAADRDWQHPPGRETEPNYYRQLIAPRLRAVMLKHLMRATGLTKGACSLIRQGKVVPHPRHWQGLAELVKEQEPR
jgi:CRISPR-associated endonuclease Cas1